MNEPTPTDAELLQRMADKDPTAMAILYARYAGPVFAVAYNVVRSHEVAEEVVQDTFIRCWTKAPDYQPARARNGTALPWLKRVARNRAIDVLRKQHAAATFATLADNIQLDHLDHVDGLVRFQQDRLLRLIIAEALEQLPAKQRQVVELAYFHDLPRAEIAERLGVPRGTVGSLLFRALQRLRQALRDI